MMYRQGKQKLKGSTPSVYKEITVLFTCNGLILTCKMRRGLSFMLSAPYRTILPNRNCYQEFMSTAFEVCEWLADVQDLGDALS